MAYRSLWDNFGVRLGPIQCNFDSTTGKSVSFRACVRAKLRVAVSPMRFSPAVLVSLRSIAPVAGGGGCPECVHCRAILKPLGNEGSVCADLGRNAERSDNRRC